MHIASDHHAPKTGKIGISWGALLALYYLCISVLLAIFYQNTINADGISYLCLAQKYLAGDFREALSGHWAPLISWLLVPFLYLGVDPIPAFRIMSTLTGAVCLFGIDLLLQEMAITRKVRILYLLSLSPVIAWYGQNFVGTDLLCACALVFYVHSLIKADYRCSESAGLKAGVLGAISYLAKNYNFYFFFLHFFCVHVCHWLRAANQKQKSTIVTNFVTGMIAFALISGIWVGLISWKYQKLTAGTAGSYNISLVRPGSPGHPVQTDGFFAPPNASAVSVWEDPTYIKLAPWSPFASGADFRYYLKLVLSNVGKYLAGLATNVVFDATFVALAYLILFRRRRLEDPVYFIILTILLYPVGYFALYYDGQRYVLINALLLYVLSAYLINLFVHQYQGKRIYVAAISLGLCLSLVSLTSYRLYIDYKTSILPLKESYAFSSEISRRCNMNGKRIATQNSPWNFSLELAYYLKARYLGEAKPGISDNELKKELLDRHIDYYFVYGNLDHTLDLLKPEQRVASQPEDLTVYRVRLEK